MSGISIEVNVDKITSLLGRAVAALERPQDMFGHIGEELIKIHRLRFKTQKSPAGVPWQPLNPIYQAIKEENNDKILIHRGHLSRTLSYNADATGVEFGSNRPYAAIHQFGGTIRPRRKQALRVGHRVLKAVHIPARPWLGLSADDERRIVQIAQKHLQNAFGA